jgi:hypothetical protein
MGSQQNGDDIRAAGWFSFVESPFSCLDPLQSTCLMVALVGGLGKFP